MTWLDFVILLAILGFMGLGFAQGLIRRLIDLASLYLGLVVAALYGPRVSRFVETTLGPSETPGREALIFLGLVAIVVVGLNTAGYLTYRETGLPFSGTVDRLSGLVAGLVTGMVWILFSLLLIHFLIQVPWPAYDGVRKFFADAWRGSLLVPFFSQGVPLISFLVTPWLPAGLPAILSMQ